MDFATDPASIGIIIGTGVAAFLAFLFRYRAKPEEKTSSLHGAAIIDSSEIQNLREAIVALTKTEAETSAAAARQAKALEKIADFLIERDRDQQRAEYERLRRVAEEAEELRKENDELRRKSRQRPS